MELPKDLLSTSTWHNYSVAVQQQTLRDRQVGMLWSGQDRDLCCWSMVSKACGQSINEQLVDQRSIYWISHRPTLGLNTPSQFGHIGTHTRSVNATRRLRASAYHHGITTGPLPIHNCWRQLQQSSQAKDHRRLTQGSLSASPSSLGMLYAGVHPMSDLRVLRDRRTVARWGTKDPSHLAIPRLRRSSVVVIGSGISATAEALDGSAAIPSALNLCAWKISSFTPHLHLGWFRARHLLFLNTGSGGIDIFEVNIWNVNCVQKTAFILNRDR